MLGTRYTCFTCGTKFYDLNRPEPLCPECGTDQREAPVRDIRALLSGGPRVAVDDSEPEFDDPTSDEGDDEENEDDEMFDEYED
ncbi:MAG: FYDLN acid domain-containing protein [Deltaproteobacteria bacterium]|nr:FYDLN acid domain-containing protein [Deltaproteobacteria bacterium]